MYVCTYTIMIQLATYYVIQCPNDHNHIVYVYIHSYSEPFANNSDSQGKSNTILYSVRDLTKTHSVGVIAYYIHFYK